MADISKIKPDGTTYNLKDELSRTNLNKILSGAGNGSKDISFTTPLSELENGVVYRVPSGNVEGFWDGWGRLVATFKNNDQAGWQVMFRINNTAQAGSQSAKYVAFRNCYQGLWSDWEPILGPTVSGDWTKLNSTTMFPTELNTQFSETFTYSNDIKEIWIQSNCGNAVYGVDSGIATSFTANQIFFLSNNYKGSLQISVNWVKSNNAITVTGNLHEIGSLDSVSGRGQITVVAVR